MKKSFRSFPILLLLIIVCSFTQTSCKNTCPTYMTGTEVMMKEIEMRERKSTVKRDRHGRVKKKKRRGVMQ